MKEIFELLDDRQLIATEKIYDFNPPKDVPRFTMHISNVKTNNKKNIHYKTKKYNKEKIVVKSSDVKEYRNENYVDSFEIGDHNVYFYIN